MQKEATTMIINKARGILSDIFWLINGSGNFFTVITNKFLFFFLISFFGRKKAHEKVKNPFINFIRKGDKFPKLI